MKEQDAANSLTETRIDYLTKMVLSHLGDYAIKGAIVRIDVQNLVVESRLLQSELTRLRSELQQKDKIIKELIPLAQENAEGICSISESYKCRAQAIVERAKESLKES